MVSVPRLSGLTGISALSALWKQRDLLHKRMQVDFELNLTADYLTQADKAHVAKRLGCYHFHWEKKRQSLHHLMDLDWMDAAVERQDLDNVADQLVELNKAANFEMLSRETYEHKRETALLGKVDVGVFASPTAPEVSDSLWQLLQDEELCKQIGMPTEIARLRELFCIRA